MRGEDVFSGAYLLSMMGSPPHARGRRASSAARAWTRRITPACAGKTRRRSPPQPFSTDHPRMRGEDNPGKIKDIIATGSPPHARGRHGQAESGDSGGGITPACAGKTPGIHLIRFPGADHPRMRGEDTTKTSIFTTPPGSPPHARGRPAVKPGEIECSRITPACAGKTTLSRQRIYAWTDHPRMRGEDVHGGQSRRRSVGSPPHARGRLACDLLTEPAARITPACAGKTRLSSFLVEVKRDHPRMRGEDSFPL